MENATDRSLTIASSLATIISKNFAARSTSNSHLLDRCPTYVAKEKSSSSSKSNKWPFGRTKKTLVVRGHHFELKQYASLTHCNHSQEMIWGIGPQGYKCSRKYQLIVQLIRFGLKSNQYSQIVDSM